MSSLLLGAFLLTGAVLGKNNKNNNSKECEPVDPFTVEDVQTFFESSNVMCSYSTKDAEDLIEEIEEEFNESLRRILRGQGKGKRGGNKGGKGKKAGTEFLFGNEVAGVYDDQEDGPVCTPVTSALDDELVAVTLTFTDEEGNVSEPFTVELSPENARSFEDDSEDCVIGGYYVNVDDTKLSCKIVDDEEVEGFTAFAECVCNTETEEECEQFDDKDGGKDKDGHDKEDKDGDWEEKPGDSFDDYEKPGKDNGKDGDWDGDKDGNWDESYGDDKDGDWEESNGDDKDDDWEKSYDDDSEEKPMSGDYEAVDLDDAYFTEQ